MLFGRIYRTIGLISVLVILYFLAIRWVLMALKRKAFPKTSSEEEPEIDYTTLDEGSRKLIGNVIVVFGIFGLWVIWLKMLPRSEEHTSELQSH